MGALEAFYKRNYVPENMGLLLVGPMGDGRKPRLLKLLEKHFGKARLKPRGKEKRENWLLRKIDDAYAGATDTLVETALTSVATGRRFAPVLLK